MKTLQKLTLILIMAILPAFSFATEPGDGILGMWVTAKGTAKVQIYKSGNKYYGKLVSGSALYESDGKTLKKDTRNDEPAKRQRSVMGLVLLNGFTYDDGIWADGTIYDPENGSTYSCKMKLKGATLEIRGYIGVSLFGRTEIWKRA